MMEHSVIGTSKVGCNFQKRMNELLLHQTEFINPRNHMQYPDHMFLLGKSQNWTLWLLMKEKGPRMWAAGAGMLSHFSSVCYCCSPHAHPSRFPHLNSQMLQGEMASSSCPCPGTLLWSGATRFSAICPSIFPSLQYINKTKLFNYRLSIVEW